MFFTAPIYANMGWVSSFLLGPPYLLQRFSLWAIGIGLAIEFIYILIAFPFGIKKAFLADIAINIISLISGIILVPLGYITWELSIVPFTKFLNMFYLIESLGTLFVIIPFINTIIEAYALKRIFKVSFKPRSRFWGLCLINFISSNIPMLEYIPMFRKIVFWFRYRRYYLH